MFASLAETMRQVASAWRRAPLLPIMSAIATAGLAETGRLERSLQHDPSLRPVVAIAALPVFSLFLLWVGAEIHWYKTLWDRQPIGARQLIPIAFQTFPRIVAFTVIAYGIFVSTGVFLRLSLGASTATRVLELIGALYLILIYLSIPGVVLGKTAIMGFRQSVLLIPRWATVILAAVAVLMPFVATAMLTSVLTHEPWNTLNIAISGTVGRAVFVTWWICNWSYRA